MQKIIFVTGRCNQKCLFCFAPRELLYHKPLETIKNEIDQYIEQGFDSVAFSGGEPTLNERLYEATAYAAGKMKFDSIMIQTNGITFSNPANARRAKDNGVTHALVAFHSHISNVSDFLTQSPGTWKKTRNGIYNLHTAGLNVTLNIVVTQINYGLLTEFIGYIAKEMRFIRSLTISVVNPDGYARSNSWIVPRYSHIASSLIEAHSLSAKLWIESSNEDCGIPICFLRDIAPISFEHLLAKITAARKGEDGSANDYSAPHKVKGPNCRNCKYHASCDGMWRGYAALYGLDELRPVLNESGSECFPIAGKDVPEKISNLKTRWVRLTKTCNNHCVFCLDTEQFDGSMISRDEVENEIKSGRDGGAEILILSGGEPTIHPDFFHFISYAKNLGYSRVQTTTNGRMFSIPTFCDEALKSGLDHVSFSIHSHVNEINDTLTGVKGSSQQSLNGLKNVLSNGRATVRANIVINRLNKDSLLKIIRHLHKLGVREFELRQPVLPRKIEPANIPMINFRQGPLRLRINDLPEDVTLRANRIPPQCLEGMEFLITSPDHLYEDVNGRADLFNAFLDGNHPLGCESAKCKLCILRTFCGTLKAHHETLIAKQYHGINVDSAAEQDAGFVRGALKLTRDNSVCITAASPSLLEKFLSTFQGNLGNVMLNADKDSDPIALLEAASKYAAVSRITLRSPANLAAIMDYENVEARIFLNIRNVPWLLENIEFIERRKERFIFSYETHESLECARNELFDLNSLAGSLPSNNFRFSGIPPCIWGKSFEHPDLFVDISIFSEELKINLQAFTRYFIKRLYNAKSLSCRFCAEDARCPGMHINYLRALGMKVLKPAGSAIDHAHSQRPDGEYCN